MVFSNKVIVITGASAGIGAATAQLFAKQSATLVLVGRNEIALREIGTKCEESCGIKPLLIKADLTNDEDVKSIVTKTIDEFGKIDVLINNAGIGVVASLTDGVEFYDRVMNTNVRSVYLLTSLATTHLIKSKGTIVNVSSVAGIKPIQDFKFLPYGMSKAALDQFTRHLALELSPYGIRVNSVNPGATKTKFAVSAGLSEHEAAKTCENYVKKLPLGKAVETNEVGELIVYLASSCARSITGSIFVIDNGELLM